MSESIVGLDGTRIGGSRDVDRPRPDARASKGRRLHPWPVRIMHWTNAVAMLIMIASGWGIYDDSVIIRGLHFSRAVRLGEWAPESLLWHFAGMWLLMLNGLAYLVYGLVVGRFRERLLPIRIGDFVRTVRDTLHFKSRTRISPPTTPCRRSSTLSPSWQA